METKTVVSLIGALTVILAVGGWIAHAEDAIKQTRSNEQQIQLLTDLHKKQAGKEEGEREAIRRLCRQGKLDPKSDECKAVEAQR